MKPTITSIIRDLRELYARNPDTKWVDRDRAARRHAFLGVAADMGLPVTDYPDDDGWPRRHAQALLAAWREMTEAIEAARLADPDNIEWVVFFRRANRWRETTRVQAPDLDGAIAAFCRQRDRGAHPTVNDGTYRPVPFQLTSPAQGATATHIHPTIYTIRDARVVVE